MCLSGYTAIPLDKAWYCQSCAAIIDAPTCCLCGGDQHTARLAHWLHEPPISLPASGVTLTVIPAPRLVKKST